MIYVLSTNNHFYEQTNMAKKVYDI